MTYTIYELKLKPLSGWITDLTADTIFGHLCWQIKYEFNDNILRKFLQEMEKKPIFTISDVIFQNNFPKPLVDENFVLPEKLNEDFYNRNKKFLKDEKILNKLFRKIFNSNDLAKDILEIKKKYVKNQSKVEENIVNKNIISRFSGTTGENGIYSLGVNNSNYTCSIFIKVSDEKKLKKYKIKDLIKKIFTELGFGKKKSIGYGIFDFIEGENENKNTEWKERNDLIKENGKNILLLSSFIPSKSDPTNGNYKLFTKFPKLGEEFSIEGLNFYKKPLVMIDKGATFKIYDNVGEGKGMSENKYKGYVGRMIKDVAIEKNIKDEKGNKVKVYHYAYGFTLEF